MIVSEDIMEKIMRAQKSTGMLYRPTMEEMLEIAERVIENGGGIDEIMSEIVDLL